MSPTILEVLKAWYLFALSVGIYTCVSLALSRKGDKNVHITLMIFVGLLLIPILNAYLQVVLASPLNVFTLLSQNLTWTYGPLLLLVVKHVLLEKISRKLSLLHFLPWILVNIHRFLEPNIVGEKPYLIQLVFLQTFLYSTYAIYLLVKNKARLISLVKNHSNTTYFWLLFIASSLLAVCLFDVVLLNFYFSGRPINIIMTTAIASMISFYVSIISLFALHQPGIFLKESAIEGKPPIKIDRHTVQAHRNTELSPEAVNELNIKLNTLVSTNHLHLDDALSLDKLAALLGVTRNQASELLNVHNETTFYDFLNELRFKEAIRLLNRQEIHISVIDIAYQAGFKNRNSFYKVFKEKTGLTPTKYKLQGGV